MKKLYFHTRLLFRQIIVFLTYTFCFTAYGEAYGAKEEPNQIIELQTETLPSLNIKRAGHVVLCLDGVVTVFGGHTDGFVPTATAEYLCDSAWHTVPLTYTHDQGIVLRMNSGKVFLAGGHREPLGIGQHFSSEIYDPMTHGCQGFGCMHKKRAFANAVEMDNGNIVISGSWYSEDGIEMFENIEDQINLIAKEMKDTSLPRTMPYMLKISHDDAIIFSSLDNKGESANSAIVDRVKAPPYHEPFLDKWHPLQTIYTQRSNNHFIGDESAGRYEWLLPVEDEEKTLIAIAHVKGLSANDTIPVFSLLPIQSPIPTSIGGIPIIYGSLICDRERGIAYLIGNDDESRIIVVSIEYDTEGPATTKIYMTCPQPISAKSVTPVLTPEGDLIFAGGFQNNNFYPTNDVILLPLGNPVYAHDGNTSVATTDHKGYNLWLWIIVSCLTIGGVCAIFFYRRKKRMPVLYPDVENLPASVEDALQDKNLCKDDILADVFNRIVKLMDEDHLYLDANMKASDVAARVGSNTAYVSASVNSQRGCSFTQFLNSYRIAYAQNLMRQDPKIKISEISTLSGFSTDSTFFRAFRSVTGMSPKEWMKKIQDEKPS